MLTYEMKCIYDRIKHERKVNLAEKKICNHCGKELDFFDLQNDFTIHRKIEYGSIYDGCTADLHLCCNCFDVLAEKCKVFPITEDSNTGDNSRTEK